MKKFLCVFLAAIILACVFSGCKKGGTAVSERRLAISYDSTYKFDSSVKSAYERICNAVLDGEDEVRLNVALLDDALRLFNTSFPLNEIVESLVIKSDSSGIFIKYKENRGAQEVSEFQNKIFEIMDECASTNNTEYVIKVYNYVASHIVYDEESSTAYDAVMNGMGNSFAYSLLFEYLLEQKNIPTYHILGTDAAGRGWGVSSAELGGNIYYFDVMSEFEENGGKLLHYFAMTSDELETEGIFNPIYTNRSVAADASDLTFEPCRYADSWKIENNALLLTKNDGVIVELAL